MKKLGKIFVLGFAMLMCIVFSACGDKYKNLSINFFASNGDSLSSVRLVMDEDSLDNVDLSTATIKVKLEGIKEKDVGDVDIQVPSFVVMSDKQIGPVCSFKVTATTPSKGYIKVTHEASGKSKQLEIKVEQKSSNLTAKEGAFGYTIAIPTSGSRTALINSALLVTPVPNDSADKIYFKFKNASTEQTLLNKKIGVKTIEVGGETLIEGFELTNESGEIPNIEVVPVTTLEGYENTTYSNLVFRFNFIKSLDQESLTLKTDSKHASYVDDVLYLISNDSAENTSLEAGDLSYQYNNVQFKLMLGEDCFEDTNHINNYRVRCECDNRAIFAEYTADYKLVIQATDITDSPVTVKIFVESKEVGDVEPVELSIKVKGEAKPTDIDVKKDGELVEKSATGNLPNINLFDYYSGDEHAYGSRFSFVPVVEESYEDLRAMRIYVSPSILNNDINKVFTDSKFEETYTGEIGIGNNMYTLEFRFAERNDTHFNAENNKLKFYYNQDKLVSELIYSSDVLYIKYQENSTYKTNENLSISVHTTYVGELDYMKNISTTTLDIDFNRQEGVKSVQFDVDSLSKEGNTYKLDKSYLDANALYLNKAEGLDLESEDILSDKSVYVLNMVNVLGSKDELVNSATFKISISGGGTNPLYLYQPNYGTGNLNVLIPTTSYTYRSSDATTNPNNALILVYNKDTDTDKYTITFSNENGFSRSIECFVYDELQESDIGYITTGLDGDYCFNNNLGDEKLYDEYDCDYIVARGKNLKFTLDIDNKFSINDYLVGYDFKAQFNGANLSENNEYIKLTVEDKAATLTFNKGTFDDGIKYITLSLIAKVQKFESVVEKGKIEEVVLTKTFFVYELIDNASLVSDGHQGETLSALMYDDLGYYYKDKATVNLGISVASEMLNYVQKSNQLASYNFGFRKVVSSDEFDENCDYYITVASKYYVKLMFVEEIDTSWDWYKFDSNTDSLVPTSTRSSYALIDGEFCLIQQDVNAETYFNSHKGNLYVAVNNASTSVVWRLNLMEGVGLDTVVALGQEDTSISFYCGSYITSYQVEVIAMIRQFKITKTLRSIVTVTKPKISDSVKIENTLKVAEETGTKYISLRAGSDYTLNAKACFADGRATDMDLMLIVVDSSGYNKTASNNHITIKSEGNSYKFTVEKHITQFTGLKLYIVAKDAIGSEIINGSGGYNNFATNFLLDGHRDAYEVVELLFSDGSESNPYTVFDASDFWEINHSLEDSKAHYVLMNNINLSAENSYKRPIESFSGSIKSFGDNRYALYNINLNNEFVNLFTNLTGKISNVKFVAKYSYNNVSGRNLGVIGTLSGELTNVAVEISGGATKVNGMFGGLVGSNSGTIQYTEVVTGVSGNITIDETSSVYFGGLVGENIGTIEGLKESVEATGNGITLNAFVGDEGSLGCLKIESEQSTKESAVAGIVGYNKGTIKYAYVTGSVKGVYNVGGAVGVNEQARHLAHIVMNGDDLADITLSEEAQVAFITSSVKVKGQTNVGGVVGDDKNGIYTNCKYQIVESLDSQVVGTNNVGGIAGESLNGFFKYCSVYAYGENAGKISGTNYVAGIVGCSLSSLRDVEEKTFIDNILKDNDNCYATVVVNSGVSANISNSGSYVAGLLCDYNNPSYVYSLILNAYYIGTLSGDTMDAPDVINNQFDRDDIYIHAFSNYVYGVNGTSGLVVKPESDFSIDQAPAKSGWAYDENINGGYIYLTYEATVGEGTESRPIFDIAPTQVSAVVPLGDEDYQHKDNILDSYNEILNLYYYSYDGVSSSDQNYAKLTERLLKKNTYSLNYGSGNETGLFNISALPSGIVARLKVVSSDSTVAKIDGDKVVITGVGQATLTFSSILSGAKTTVTIYVTLPFGESVDLRQDKNDSESSIQDETIGIGKDSGQIFYEVITNEQDNLNPEYEFASNSSLNYEVKVDNAYIKATEYTEGTQYYQLNSGNYEEVAIIDSSAFDAFGVDLYIKLDINEILNISGFTADENVFEVLDGKPFIVNVLNKVEDATFHFVAKPYIIIKHNGTDIKKYSGDEISFFIKTSKGVSKLALNYDSLVVYPTDITTITLTATTDLEVENGDIEIVGTANCYKAGKTTTFAVNNSNVENFIKLTRIGSLSGNKQTLLYTLQNTDMFGLLESGYEKIVLNLTFKTNGIATNLQVNMLRERIATIDIVNYIYDEDGNIEVKDVLKPDNDGLIILNVVPDVAYYDYLEIVDETGTEEITFIQIGSTDRQDYGTGWVVPAVSGHGIKLNKNKNDDANDLNVYIRTFVDKEFSTRMHKVVVYAFVDDNSQPIAKFTKYIEVRMLPAVMIDNILPDDSLENKQENKYFAAEGVDIRFRATTKNSDGDQNISILMSGDKDWQDYYILQENNGFYTLKAKGLNYKANSTIGETLTITISTTATHSSGDFEIGTQEVIYEIKDFVVYGVSVVGKSIKNGNDLYIYGNYGETIDLEFYFDYSNISLRDENSFWSTRYTEATSNTAVKEILSALNKQDNVNRKNRVSLQFVDANGIEIGHEETNILELINKGNVVAELKGNTLTVFDDVGLAYLLVTYEDGENESHNFSTMFRLQFSKATSFLEPIAITSEVEFLSMQSGNNNYILATDLELFDYSPISVDVASFDGNGHSITIKSFAPFNESEIMAGLFKEIPEDMVVSNLTVVYDQRNFGRIHQAISSLDSGKTAIFEVDKYYDFCNSYDNLGNLNVDYTSLRFGGITPLNNGIITNCCVKGDMAVSASAIENKIVDYKVDMQVAGLVCDNSSTGYITNSRSELKIVGQANIAGFVYTNAGKIASSYFDANFTSKKGLIYAYNNNINKMYAIEVAGFVNTNSGEISMSYVETGFTTVDVDLSIGDMSAKNESAGFVYTNNGLIYDCYVDVSKGGSNNNTFYGFVRSNGGKIKNSYTRINGANGYLFAKGGTTGIENCYEIRIGDSQIVYDNEIDGLTTIMAVDSTLQSAYKGFAFGTIVDDSSAVWIMETYPKHVATRESVAMGDYYDIEIETCKREGEEYYTGLKNLTKKYYVFDESTGEKVYLTKAEANAYVGTVNYAYEVTSASKAYYGTKYNPIIIYSVEMWDYYLAQNSTTNKYYRLVKDIDFSAIKENPSTATVTFGGNIQGNNMDIMNITLYSSETLYSLGLFSQLVGTNNIAVNNAIRNIDLSLSSVQATKTQVVGGLAGLVENFNLYNIDISADGVVLVGNNAVGGLAGLVRGKFDIDQVSSNASAHSVYPSGGGNYEIYISKNNREIASYNLDKVSYAGSLVGILDGYLLGSYSINDSKALPTEADNTKYCYIQNAVVEGNIVLMADTVGGLFGLVGERVWVNNAKSLIAGGELIGVQYTSAFVGENRGVINNAVVDSDIDGLLVSDNVMAGLVGLNLGGFVDNSTVLVTIHSTSATVGGIVGRNVNGAVRNSTFDGEISGKFTGGIIGTNYSKEMMKGLNNSAGALKPTITDGQRNNLIPSGIKYSGINDVLTNVSVTKDALDYWLNNLKTFYAYEKANLRVLGLFVGVDELDANKPIKLKEQKVNVGTENETTIYFIFYDFANNKLIFNGENGIEKRTVENAKISDDKTKTLTTYTVDGLVNDYTYVTYLVGTRVVSFDVWQSTYYGEMILLFTCPDDALVQD